jgi:RNA polymerase sigma factor (sigma-70 family)
MVTQRDAARVEQLVRQHHGLVECIVERYTRRYYVGSMEREDLVSWGLIGLYHAARAWDESRNLRFSTLAWKVIERSIRRGVQREWRPEEAQATVSLDDPLPPSGFDPGDETPLGQLLADPRVEEDARSLDTVMAVRVALDRLSARDREQIRQRFFEGRSCAEIGERFGKSRQTIHLREKSILRHLRQELSPAFEERSAA